jgi:hypothetical protein
LFSDLLRISEFKNQKAVEELKKRYSEQIGKYADQQKEIDVEARKLEREVDLERHRADRFDLGESFLEIALVVTSITLLTKKRVFWGAGIVAAVVGLLIVAFGLTLH